MRHLIKYSAILSLLSMYTPAHAEDLTSRSYLTAQPFSLIPIDITFSNIMDQYHEDGSVLNRPQLQVVAFGGRSTGQDDIRNYFFWNDLQALKMNEDPDNDLEPARNIIGYNFNIETTNGTQTSLITLDPKQTFYGVGLSFRYGFKEKWWTAIEVPFVSVTNNLNLSEGVLIDGGGLNTTALGFDAKPVTATTMIEAFRQPGMLYGRIEGPQKKNGLGDILLYLGYDFVDKKDNYLSPFIGFVLPTSNRPKAIYMWEPVTGNNKHAGIILGAYGHSVIHEKNDNQIWFTWSTNNQYLFRNRQRRSFDLNRGPWTRYLAMYANDTQRQSPIQTLGTDGIKTFGINIMTQDVHVTPGFSNFSTISMSWINNHLHTTLGASTFIRESENIELANQWVLGPEVADLANNNASNMWSNIGTLASNGTVNGTSLILAEDINYASATNTNFLVSSIYATLGYYTTSDHPALYELGISYENSKQNNAINRFTAWGKFQITF